MNIGCWKYEDFRITKSNIPRTYFQNSSVSLYVGACMCVCVCVCLKAVVDDVCVCGGGEGRGLQNR